MQIIKNYSQPVELPPISAADKTNNRSNFFCKKKLMIPLLLVFSLISSSALATNHRLFRFLPKRPLYLGFGAGLGTTFWREFTAKTSPAEPFPTDDPTFLARQAVPANATGYGVATQVLVGLYLSDHFALQFDYEILPQTRVQMKDHTLYSKLPEGDFTFNSTSFRYDLIAKYLVSIMHSSYQFYVDIGPNWTARDDAYANKDHYIGAVFGLGFNTYFKDFFQLDLGYQYTTGAGKASIIPLYDYMPFTGSLMLSTSIRF